MVKKLNRNKIIQRASEIIKENPALSRRDIEKQLKGEFGRAIRSSELLKLRQQLSPRTASEALNQKRYDSLRNSGFLDEEAKFYIKTRIPLKAPGMQMVVRFRRKEINKAKQSGIKNTDRYIRDSYRASGWTDVDGSLRPDFYNENVYQQVSQFKPSKRKGTLLIEPDNYRKFQRIVARDKFSPEDAAYMASIIPTDQWADRMIMYRYLRRVYFSHTEAFHKITATSRNKEGKLTLQSLNLNDAAIQTEIHERINYANKRIKELINKGMTPYEARKAVKNEIANKTKGNKPAEDYEWLKEFYKWQGKNRKIKDFNDGLRKRAIRMSKKKMMYKVRR